MLCTIPSPVLSTQNRTVSEHLAQSGCSTGICWLSEAYEVGHHHACLTDKGNEAQGGYITYPRPHRKDWSQDSDSETTHYVFSPFDLRPESALMLPAFILFFLLLLLFWGHCFCFWPPFPWRPLTPPKDLFMLRCSLLC